KVRDAVVNVWKSGQDSRLVAYIVGEEGTEISNDELLDFLRRSLPEYMVPSSFMQLRELPQLPNGKVNRHALPAPNNIQATSFYVSPRTDTEEKLAKIWGKVLDIESVGIFDNFFEIGGHSLLITRIRARIRDAFNV